MKIVSQNTMKLFIIKLCALLLFLFYPVLLFSEPKISDLLSKLSATQSDSIKSNLYFSICKYYRYEKPDSATYYAAEGQRYFNDRGYKLGEAKMLGLLGTLAEMRGVLVVAQRRFEEELALYNQIGSKIDIALTNNSLGVVEGRKANYKIATQYFMSALQTFVNLSDTEDIVDTYIKLGAVNELTNNLDNALEYYDDAYKIEHNKPVSVSGLTLLNNIGVVYCKRKEYKKAMDYFSAAIENATAPGFTSVRILLLINMGTANSKLNKKEIAYINFQEALKLTKQSNQPEYYAQTLYSISESIYEYDKVKAVTYLNEAVDTARKIGLKELEGDIYGLFSIIYKKNEDYKKALEYTEKKQTILDSIAGIQKKIEIANLETMFKLNQSEETVKMLKYVLKKNAIKKNIILMFAVFIFIVFIILFYFYSKSLKLNNELLKKQFELEKANNVKDKLLSVIGHDLRGPISNIPVLLEMYNDKTNDEENKLYYYDNIKELAISCKDTLDKLLFWGKKNLSGTKAVKTIFQTKEHIQNTFKLLRTSASQKNINIIDNTPVEINIVAIPEHFDFVIRNLLANAIKFTNRDGEIIVNALQNQIPGYTVFSVKDNGIGIDEKTKLTIFEGANSSTLGTNNEVGTNIGLILCKDFLRENEGEIWVESELGKGSVFYFSLKNQ